MSITGWPGCSRSDAPTAICRSSPRSRSRSATCCCSTTTSSTGPGGLAQLNNPNWPQWVSTLKAAGRRALAKGTYRPLLAPVNFDAVEAGNAISSPSGTRDRRLNVDPGQSRRAVDFEFIPSNLQRFTAKPGGRQDVPADPSLPDHQRDVQFTVNGQFQPVIKSKAGQTEIWVLANISDIAYFNVQLTETATGKHPKIAIVGQDGSPLPRGALSAIEDGHAARHSAGDALRDRRHHAGRGRPDPGDAADAAATPDAERARASSTPMTAPTIRRRGSAA